MDYSTVLTLLVMTVVFLVYVLLKYYRVSKACVSLKANNDFKDTVIKDREDKLAEITLKQQESYNISDALLKKYNKTLEEYDAAVTSRVQSQLEFLASLNNDVNSIDFKFMRAFSVERQVRNDRLVTTIMYFDFNGNISDADYCVSDERHKAIVEEFNAVKQKRDREKNV